jgi:hypothetical protein
VTFTVYCGFKNFQINSGSFEFLTYSSLTSGINGVGEGEKLLMIMPDASPKANL